ncbi:MAG: hypothetical protein HC867_08190 [Bacteroidia bacterium]|nr:hypothetical protein [Bacteroidia bacterium]
MDSIWVNTQLFESIEQHTFFAQNMYEVKELFITKIN